MSGQSITLFHMATDGADFQRRRPIHGAYYVSLKNGASVERLAEVSIECLSRDVRSRPMPMLRPMVDAIVHHLSSESLFAADKNCQLYLCNAAIREIEGKFADFGACPDVTNACLRTAAELAQDGVRSTEAALESVGSHLQQIQCFEYAKDYAAHHRKLDERSTEALFQLQEAASAAVRKQLIQAIYDSPTGMPRRSKRKKGEGFDYSPAGLENYKLSEDVS